jgi:signal transduction histidine kinase
MQRRLVAAQEEERGRISRELHDEVGQHLTALLLGLRAIEIGKASPNELQKLQTLTETIGHEIHELALALRPTSLDDFGLIRSLENFLGEWEARTKIKAELHARGFGQTRVPSQIETTVYRIVGEALNNVIKHSRATHVSVVLQKKENEVTAIVEDNGVGFSAEVSNGTGGRKQLGIIGMKERAELLDGTVDLETSLNSGTTVFVRLPLGPKN